MEWIKITPETTLPNGTKVLVRTKGGNLDFAEAYECDSVEGAHVDMFDSYVWQPLYYFTHYCIITEPTD